MNFNYQKAREFMVENQLRPNKIKDKVVLDIFRNIPKEDFLPNEIKTFAYFDSDINLLKNRGYLKNLHIAQLINYSEIQKNHKVLHLGALTGYITAILSKLSNEVFAIETDNKIKNDFLNNIQKNKFENIQLVECSFEKGCSQKSPYDLIFIDNPIRKVSEDILLQLNKKLGKIIMIEKDNNYVNQAVKIVNNDDKFSKQYLFDVFSKYQLYEEKENFVF